MNTAQISACQPRTAICARKAFQFRPRGLKPSNLGFHGQRLARIYLKLSSHGRVFCTPVLKSRRSSSPVCLSKTGGDNEGSPWKAFENVMENFKGQSIEDVLRQQIEKREFAEDRDGSGGPPRGGGGGGGGGGADGSGGSEDEGLSGILDETLQVVLATTGFILLYIYIITGEELVKLAKDYLKYIFKGTESIRLKRAMYVWGRFLKKLTEKKEYDPYWLEKEIINTPTWWDSPEKYRRMLRPSTESKPSQRSYEESDSFDSYEDSYREDSYREDSYREDSYGEDDF